MNFYKIAYRDPENVLIECNIQPVGALERSSNVIEVQGFVRVEYDDINDPLEPIRTSNASISLEADTEQKFDDLFAEIERQWIVLIYRDGNLIFRGWLSPDGIYEDYVNDAWYIELNATDGITDLQNKGYVDENGDLYKGQETLRNIVLQCLERTGWTQFTRFQQRTAANTNFPFEMVTTFPSADDFFDQKVDQGVFVSSDGTTAKSCDEVLRQILNSCNAHLFSWAGEWYVNWSLQGANPNVLGLFNYQRYEIDGSFYDTVSEDTNNGVGSHIKGFYPHWAAGDQRIERMPSVGAARISYKYGDLAAVNTNPGLDNNGSTITGWTVDNLAEVTLNSDGTVELDDAANEVLLTSDPTPQPIEQGNIVVLTIKGSVSSGKYLRMFYSLTINDTTPYYLSHPTSSDEGEWTTSNNRGFANNTPTNRDVYINEMPGSFTVEVETPPIPVEGTVTVKIFDPADTGFSSDAASAFTLDFVGISSKDNSEAEGVEHLAERVAAPSSYTNPTKEMIVGDSTRTVYLGTYFQNDGTTATDQGYLTPTSAFAFPLYQKNIIDRLFIRSKPSRVFEGSVYGFLPYNSRTGVDGFPNVEWIVAGWSWDSKANTIELRLFQIHWDETMLDDTDYERTVNNGEAIEPTIKG